MSFKLLLFVVSNPNTFHAALGAKLQKHMLQKSMCLNGKIPKEAYCFLSLVYDFKKILLYFDKAIYPSVTVEILGCAEPPLFS